MSNVIDTSFFDDKTIVKVVYSQTYESLALHMSDGSVFVVGAERRYGDDLLMKISDDELSLDEKLELEIIDSSEYEAILQKTKKTMELAKIAEEKKQLAELLKKYGSESNE